MARSLLSGLIGTVAMTVTTKIEARLRGNSRQPIDYDDSRIPVRLVERILSRRFDDRTEGKVNQVIRYSYGSTAGLIRAVLDGRARRPGLAFFAVTWGVEMASLPLFGLAPPVWRWRRDVLVTSMFQHAIFATATEGTYRSLVGAHATSIPSPANRDVGHLI